MKNEMRLRRTGIVHSPFREPKGAPIEPTAALDVEGTIEIFPEYFDGRSVK